MLAEIGIKADRIDEFGPFFLTTRLCLACALAVVLIPVNAIAQGTDSDRWKQVRDCEDLISVEMFLLDYPDSSHAGEARNCLAGAQNGDFAGTEPIDENPSRAVLQTCNEHLAANRLTKGQGGTAFDCFNEILSEDPDNQDAKFGLRTIADRYAGWADAATGACDELDKAQSYLDQLVRVDSGDARIPGILLALAEKREECQTSSWGADVEDDGGSTSPAPVDETALRERFETDWSIVENQLCQVWNHGEPENYEPVTWTGGCADGKASGQGRLTGRVASTEEWRFIGNVQFGNAHGYGTYIWADGDRYDGMFRDGMLHGHGILTWTDGSRYEGDFLDDARTGRGTHVWADGSRYEGEWHDGKQHGRGTVTWTNGDKKTCRWELGTEVGGTCRFN